MNCPCCNGEKSFVTRTARTNREVQRDRQCTACGFRWRTVERLRADWEHARLALDLAKRLQEFGSWDWPGA